MNYFLGLYVNHHGYIFFPNLLMFHNAAITCDDPGTIPNAERGAVLLSVNSQVTYTCKDCYTGGGVITCQANGQWTPLPACTRMDLKSVL